MSGKNLQALFCWQNWHGLTDWSRLNSMLSTSSSLTRWCWMYIYFDFDLWLLICYEEKRKWKNRTIIHRTPGFIGEWACMIHSREKKTEYTKKWINHAGRAKASLVGIQSWSTLHAKMTILDGTSAHRFAIAVICF